MRNFFKKIINKLEIGRANRKKDSRQFLSVYKKYQDYTMVPMNTFLRNISLVNKFRHIPGDIVECGVWKGGMIAAISEVIENKKAFLFDSYAGLPEVQEIDGCKAIKWQKNPDGEFYYDNCTADENFAIQAMNMSGVPFESYKGWFKDTLKPTIPIAQIAILRLDVDWYESTMDCLDFFYPKVSNGGLILIDDYYTWDGCSKAVHDYLSKSNSKSKLCQYRDSVAYIIKEEE